MPSSELLPYDIALRILELSQNDYAALANCALANKHLNDIASCLLYKTVVISPRSGEWVSASGIPECSNFPSACLPRYVAHVQTLRVAGYRYIDMPPRNILSKTLAEALPSFVNLRFVELIPCRFHEQVFAPILTFLSKGTLGTEDKYSTLRKAFQNMLSIIEEEEDGETLEDDKVETTRKFQPPSIHSLAVNQSCMAETMLSDLVGIEGLSRLVIESPGRAMLQQLPEWLGRLGELRELELQRDCGSITPGVLTSLIPHVKHRLTRFTLGLSYSLTDGDVYRFLNEVLNLEVLQLRYYWQLKRPGWSPSLPNLTSLTVTHGFEAAVSLARRDVNDICRYIGQLLGNAPRLSSLAIWSDDRPVPLSFKSKWDREVEYLCGSPHPRWDPLISHIISKHGKTIRRLDLASSVGNAGAFVSNKALKALLKSCRLLESISVRCSMSGFDTLRRGNDSGSLVEVEAFVCDIPVKHPLRLRAMKGASEYIDAAVDLWAKQSLTMSESTMRWVPNLGANDVWWMARLVPRSSSAVEGSTIEESGDAGDGFVRMLQRYRRPLAPWNK